MAAELQSMKALQETAERALEMLRKQGFDEAQVGVSRQRRSEVCVSNNAADLLRSTETLKLQLIGLHDGRRAASEASALDEASLALGVQALWRNVAAAPQDAANCVSSAQKLVYQQGPQQAELGELTAAMRELLQWRSSAAPALQLREALAAHNSLDSVTLTSAGSELTLALGWHEGMAMGLARDAQTNRSSSFNYAAGSCERFAPGAFVGNFGLESMLMALTRQVQTQAWGRSSEGSVVFTPRATVDLLQWLLGQLGDQALIDGSSVYRQRVGALIASPLLSMRSRFDAPGLAPATADACVAPSLELITQGRLNALTPSLYGARKTGLPQCPVLASGWALEAGSTPLAALISQVARGALVDRLSMGRPAANGDFSGVIKNSFAIVDGELGPALAETMISGNVAQMLKEVSAVSSERIDSGAWLLPWLRVDGLHFS